MNDAACLHALLLVCMSPEEPNLLPDVWVAAARWLALRGVLSTSVAEEGSACRPHITQQHPAEIFGMLALTSRKGITAVQEALQVMHDMSAAAV